MLNVSGLSCRLLALAGFALVMTIGPAVIAQPKAAAGDNPARAGGQKATADLAKAALAATKHPCSCNELTKYWARVNKEGQVYRDLFAEHRHFDSFSELNAEFGVRMGWINIRSIGKGGAEATDDQKKAARSQCEADGHCDWICDVSINGVHEKYHDWFDAQASEFHLLGREILDRTETALRTAAQIPFNSHTRWRKTDDKIKSEIGAHDAESRFLQDTIVKAIADGKCEGPQSTNLLDPSALLGTPSAAERDKRFDDTRSRLKSFLDNPNP
jgi:hypothetical protein